MKDMDENQDVGASGFEDRIRTLFGDGGATRGVSTASVIRGARRRRMRNRATVAGSSLAVLGVAAAGAFAVHGHDDPRSAAGNAPTTSAATSPAAVGTATAPTPSTTTSGTTSGTAETCSASVTGTVPTLPRTTADGLDFETVSGTTAGIPWAVQIHAFPSWQSWLDWRDMQANPPAAPGTDPAKTGPPALFRGPDAMDFIQSAVSAHLFGFAGVSIGGGTGGSSKAYLDEGWTEAAVDHICLQFAHHAEFTPVYRIGGRGFAVFGYTKADEPQEAIGYNSTGEVVGTMSSKSGLLPPAGG